MNKSELIDAYAEQHSVTKTEAKARIESVLESVASAVRCKGSLSLKGFGNFKITNRKARTGRNPQTGATIQIAAKDVVTFKPQF